MQSTFLSMLAALAVMSIGVDASAISQALAPPTFSSAPASNSTGQQFVCYPANQAIFTVIDSVVQSTFFPTATATSIAATITPRFIDISNTTSPTSNSSSPDGQVFVCYPVNEPDFTIVTSVVQSTFFPTATDSIVIPTAN
ncbi:hypothetical protein BJ912DRAFT_972022 [Pholiota molesta]|nr:hypothetical protein BJ912DRAFT_972022 [Pholiota molesta]